MVHYIIQIVAFQLLFLLSYDLFLKKETFFNLNRGYLLITPILSLVLPFIKIEKFKEVVPQEYVFYLPEGLIEASQKDAVIATNWLSSISIFQWILFLGSLTSLILFIFKLVKIYALKVHGKKIKHHQFTEIIIEKSSAAFSFFRNIFLGEEVLKKEHKHIIEHELVHINQKHSWDLIFFEILRIVFWFNPLIYIYQLRITELHEFIADAHTVKTNKKEHYQHLLEEVFKTEKISFINQFFNHSLIKKRIVMLQKSKSKKVWQLKYLLLVPVLIGMLIYTSCEKESSSNKVDNLIESEKEEIVKSAFRDIVIPFSSITVKPSFKEPCLTPNIEHNECFMKKLNEHVIKNFKYPEEAKKQGIEGKVYINFRINTDGTVEVINTRAPHPILEQEGIRIIESLPLLNPGTDDKGNIAPVTFAYPIVFKLK